MTNKELIERLNALAEWFDPPTAASLAVASQYVDEDAEMAVMLRAAASALSTAEERIEDLERERERADVGVLAEAFAQEGFTHDDIDRINLGITLWNAVIAIWQHTEKHTTYVDGVGYTSRSDQQTCGDPTEHARLVAAEGKAWHDYAESSVAAAYRASEEHRLDCCPTCNCRDEDEVEECADPWHRASEEKK